MAVVGLRKRKAPQMHNYWEESRVPLASLMFVAPLLLFYEIGVVVLGPEAVRNGAEVWLRQLLLAIGLGQYFFLPVLTVGILLGAHYVSRRPWYVRSVTLWGMLVESLFLAGCLRVLLGLQGLLFQYLADHRVLATGQGISAHSMVERAVAFVGAGVYEELVFRLILLNAIVGVARVFHPRPAATLASGIVVSSLIFAAAHHIGPFGEPFAFFAFLFRFMAGVFFAFLFVYRGFGIVAGAHAAYDLLVGLV